MILADSSVWIEHFRKPNPRIEELVRSRQLRMHPFVLGELALGSLAHREEVLVDLAKLVSVPEASNDEVLHLIESKRLFSRGIGLVDAHLLVATIFQNHCLLWSRDRRLVEVARELGVADDRQ